MKTPNPQGKGTDLLVNHWHPALRYKRKSVEVIIKDYFQSLLVLSARLAFKPVVRQQYYLYLWDSELRLSLIEPYKLKKDGVEFIASCQLRDDLTWHMQFSEQSLSPSVLRFLEAFYDGFVAHLDSDAPLKELLPYYQQGLGYHARVFANGLSKSLSTSLPQQNAPVLARECLTLVQHKSQLGLPVKH